MCPGNQKRNQSTMQHLDSMPMTGWKRCLRTRDNNILHLFVSREASVVPELFSATHHSSISVMSRYSPGSALCCIEVWQCTKRGAGLSASNTLSTRGCWRQRMSKHVSSSNQRNFGVEQVQIA
eukprot:TRINITY_DN19355_c0_g1_i1.p1 TRINITY_DN19355_c0_g1~~TRINITY_DN19355_c0_g1_i1.p1  ORF type:complete len:123 (+),score=7.61 TRINITY_DN19355_c0_g1_i1:154-522(+)